MATRSPWRTQVSSPSKQSSTRLPILSASFLKPPRWWRAAQLVVPTNLSVHITRVSPVEAEFPRFDRLGMSGIAFSC